MSRVDYGYINRNGLKVINRLPLPAPNHPYARGVIMECGDCKYLTVVNTCDAHERLCPNCQGGKGRATPPQ